MNHSEPAVVILNMSYTGLGIARSLAGRGIRVLGLSADPKVFGCRTRLCEVRIAPDSETEADSLTEYLLRLAKDHPGAIVFPTRDLDIRYLDTHREALSGHLDVVIPPDRSLSIARDKKALVESALRAGVSAPRTLVVDGEQDLSRVPEEVGFPCLIKPVVSFHWREKGVWEQVGGRKAFRVNNLQELTTEYRRVAAALPHALIQEMVEGESDQLASACGYFVKGTGFLGYFTARIILKHPDRLGTGCLVENVEIPELQDPTARLLEEIGYEGVADVEYKFDQATGEWKLIEINTRHWDWHELGLTSGANLSWISYCHRSGRQLPPARGPIVPTKWINEEYLLAYAFEAILQRRLSIRSLLRGVSGKRMYGVFAWRDTKPFVRLLFLDLIPRFFKAGWRRIVRRSAHRAD